MKNLFSVLPSRLYLLTIIVLFIPGISFGQANNPSDSGKQDSSSSDSTSKSPNQGSHASHTDSSGSDTCALMHLVQCVKDVAEDQAGIWTSPFRATPGDAAWLLPIAGATGVALHYDAQAQQDLGVDPTRVNASNAFSDGVLYGSLAGDAGMYLLGAATHNPHLTETGRLGAEAVVDASLVVVGLKMVTNRQRPFQGNGQGNFWPNGTGSWEWDGSFPSEHSAIMFALAHVISDEYPSKRVKIATFALALAVSASRVTARKHFPSDVLVGGTIGYLVGGYVTDRRSSNNSGILINPMMDASTQTYGLQMQFTPDGGVRTVGRLFNRLERLP